MKVFYLDNSYTGYIVMAETEEAAWAALKAKHHIMPKAEWQEEYERTGNDTPDCTMAYNDIIELTERDKSFDMQRDCYFVIG
jgi:hypothetical protein